MHAGLALDQVGQQRRRYVVRLLRQLLHSTARRAVQLGQRRVQAGAAQVDARFQRLLDMDIEPGFNRIGDELHRHQEDHQPRQHADGGKQQHQPCHQLGTELAALETDIQPEQRYRHQDQQRHRHRRVQTQQPGIIAVEKAGIVGRRSQQEQQDTDDGAANDSQVPQGRVHLLRPVLEGFLV